MAPSSSPMCFLKEAECSVEGEEMRRRRVLKKKMGWEAARKMKEDECFAEDEIRRARKIARAEEKMDKFLDECFVACVVKSSREGLLPMPIKGTILYTEFMRPCRLAGTDLDVKLSSFKVLRKFLEHLEEDGQLSLKPGVSDPMVLSIHYDHPAFGLPAEALKKGCKLTAKTSLSAPISLSGPISFGPNASRGLAPLSLGSLSLKPAWKPSWARSAKEAEGSETQSTAALTSRSDSSTLGDESSSNFGSDSVEGNESKTEDSRGSCADAADPVAMAVLRVASPTQWRRSQAQAEQPGQETRQMNQDSVARYVPPHRKSVARCSDKMHNKMDTWLRDAFLEAAAASWNSMDCDKDADPADAKRLAEVDAFIEEYGLDQSGGYRGGYSAAMALRESEAEVQVAVMKDGLQGTRSPAGTVLARIRDRAPKFRAPVKGTRIYTLHMRSRSSSNLDVKLSSWKTLGKFFKSLEEEGLLTLRPLETDPFVTSINFGHCSLLPLLGGTEAQPQELDQIVADKELECERVQEAVTDPAEHVIWLDSCGWTAGDFTTSQAWNYHMTWGPDEVSLPVEKGESLLVSKIDGAWANAASASSGRNGWMPSAILQRVVHVSIAPFSGGPGYMKIEKGDRLAVFHRDSDWVYGACLRGRTPQQAPGKESSLVRREQVHTQGWFPSSCIEWPVCA